MVEDQRHGVIPSTASCAGGESIRADGKYQFKYHINGKPHFVYSWRLEPTDTSPVGKKPCLSLRELVEQIGYDLDSFSDPMGKNITVGELVERYLATKMAVQHHQDSTRCPAPGFPDGGFLFTDKNGYPEVAMHWEHRFNHMVKRYNDIYRVQMPNITPHICRHTYGSNMAKVRHESQDAPIFDEA